MMKLFKLRYLCLVITLMCLAANPAAAWLRMMGGGGPPAPTITGITVAGTTTPSYTSGASSIGAIAVTETNGTFSGTLAIGGAANFSLSATTLPSNLNTSQTCTSTTNYTVMITPTQAGVINSGTPYSIMVTCNPPTTNPAVMAVSPESPSTGSGGSTSAVQISALTAGDILVVADYACPAQNTNCFPGGTKPNFTGVTASNGGVSSCALIPNSRSAPIDQAGTEQWQCAITASGSNVTLTGSWASTCYFCHFVALDVHNLAASPDAGIANTAYATAAASSMAVSTNGGTGANFDFIVSSMFGHNCCPGGTSITPDPSETTVVNDNSIEWIVQYKIVQTGGGNYMSSATPNTATPYNGNISGYLPTGGVAAQTISLSASPATGSCQNGATNTCMTVSAAMAPASPPFNGAGGDGGTFSLVSAATGGSVCATGTIDTSNFSIGSTSGVVAISNTGVAAGSYNICVSAATSSGNVTNTPKYTEFPISVTAPVSQTIALGPSTGTCATGATNTCATMVATMSPASPPFNGTGGDGGTYTMVASGGSCSGIDASFATDFSLNGTSGVLAIANTSIAAGSYNVCVKAATTGGTVSNTPQFQQVAVTVTTAGAAVEIGSGITLGNNGTTTSNVPVRFGYGFARGDMPLGNTLICKDEGGNTYPCQVDQLSTRTGMPHSGGETAGWQHAVISLIYTPSWTAAATHTFHVYRQPGTYSAGTGLALTALTGAHDYQIHYQNVKDFSLNVIGSGSFTCDLNNAIAAGQRTGVGGGVSSGGGGYDTIENGQIVTTIDALAPAIDDSSHSPHGQLMCEFYAMLWQSSPGSGTLGNVEIIGWIGQPWQNNGSAIGFNWGDVTLTDATTSTTLRNFSVQSNYAPTDFKPDPANWPLDGFSSRLYASQCFNTCQSGAPGSMTINGTSVTSANGAFFPTSNYSGNTYLYVGSGNSGCTQGGYQIVSVSSGTATLASSPCSGTQTVNNWQIGSGFINNNGNLENGAIIQFSATGGGTLPLGISASRPYFVSEVVNSNGAANDTPGPFAIGNFAAIGANGAWPDYNGFASQGSCPSGSCIVVTRKVGINPWSGTWLFADDSGHPFWVGSNAGGAVIYPQLSNAQKLYYESSALIPPFWTTGSATPSSPFYLQQNYGAGGPYYESMAAGPQENLIDSGGTHQSIGPMGGLEANAFLNMTQLNWDMVHTHALSQASAFGHSILNASTGYYTPYDCGLYPNGNTASCGTYGSKVGVAGGHIQNYLVWINPNNGNDWGGFTTPTVPGNGFLTAGSSSSNNAAANTFLSGIFWADGADGSNAAMSHDPDYGNDLAYIIGGEPWYLRGVQNWANWALIGQYPQGDSPVSSKWTSNGYSYTNFIMSGDTDAPRGVGWSLRNITYAAVLGADNDPGRQLFWNAYIENIDGLYEMIHNYMGQNIDHCTGCSADPNAEPMGLLELNHYYAPTFMYDYEGTVLNLGYGMTHYVSDVLSGASAQWAAQLGTRLKINMWYNMPITNGAVGGYPVSTYWAANEESLISTAYTSQYSGNPHLPGQTPIAPNAGGIWALGGDASFLPTYMESGGLMWYQGGAYDPHVQGLLQNGDAMVPDCNDDCTAQSVLTSPPYYAINVSPNITDPHTGNQSVSFNVTTTPPSTQACSSPTGSAGCPAAASFPGAPYNRLNISWRPTATQPNSSGAAGAGGTSGYMAEDWALFQMATNSGQGGANLSGAFSNLQLRYPLTTFSSGSFPSGGASGDGNWLAWYMGAVTIPAGTPPPPQTIASITATPSTGSCANLAPNMCTTVSAAMNPTTPNFAFDGGSFSLVAANATCTGTIDTSDFAINANSGVISISNTSVSPASYAVCVSAQTTASQVTNSPFYQKVSITVTAGVPTVTFTGNTNYTYTPSNPTTNSTTLSGVASGDAVIVAAGYCTTNNCGSTTPVPTLTAAATGGTCSAIAGTQSTGQSRQTELFCCTGGSGSQTYTVTFGGTPTFVITAASEFTGTNACSALEGANQNSGSGTTVSAATNGAITQTGGELVLGFAFSQNSLTAGSGQSACGNGGNMSCQTPSAAGTITTQWSMPSGGNYGASTVSLKHP